MRDRIRSLDVLRGATVALMILVNHPGSWSHLYPPLAHAAWHGCTPTDLVFPFFLFAVGNALAIVMPGLQAGPPAVFWRKLLWRTGAIFALGLLVNAAPFVRWDAAGDLVARDWSTLRTMGVLQRIALAWGAAAAIVWLAGARGALVAAAALLLGYWAACVYLGDPADPYSLAGWFGTAVDKALLGTSHLYRGEGVPFDPEGLASTAPAIAQVLLGWWVGQRLQAAQPTADTVARLFVAAVGLGVAAYLWQLAMPINKKLWTSSYVLLNTALAIAALATLVWRLDLRAVPGERPPAWVRFCEAFGTNALFVFVLSGLVPRALALLRWGDGVDGEGRPRFTSVLPWLYRTVFADLAPDPRLGSLAFAVAHLGVYWALAAWLHRRRLFIKV
ncbi:acyltransferase family protein [Ideonella sp. A 288]|uniref:acyltransferase family protein n=1 Tax=Ideonella sp. A 288 TaxID=1962181 RepID=UPI000B4C07BC|nr:heparan-alpha-glucosaminide N-acetyltransferase domain-containing protein [Ideonella sp. A 288]